MTVEELAQRLPAIDKQALLASVVASLQSELDAVVAAQRATQQGATHEEAKPESDKDTRATESSYLARGQARRVEELSTDLTRLAAVRPTAARGGAAAVGSLLVLEDAEAESSTVETVFLLPAAGGLDVEVEGISIKIVTPKSPLGKGLIGRGAGDEVEVFVPRGKRCYVVVAIA